MSDKPALEAIDGGKGTQTGGVRPEDEIRSMLRELTARHGIQHTYLKLQASMGSLDGTADAARALMVVEAHIKALRYCLKEADGIR